MKLLCIIQFLANISLFLWEYRSGEFKSKKQALEISSNEGSEKILLVSELKSDKPLYSNSTLPVLQDLSNETPVIQSDAPPSKVSADDEPDSSGGGPLP